MVRAGFVIEQVDVDDPRAVSLRGILDADLDERYRDADRDDPPGFAEKRSAALAVHRDQVVATLLAVDADGTPLGHVILRRLDAEWELKRLIVTERARRRGVGRALTERVVEIARAGGARRVILQSGRMQPESLVLYAAAGFTPIPVYEPYIETMPRSLCFERVLPAPAPPAAGSAAAPAGRDTGSAPAPAADSGSAPGADSAAPPAPGTASAPAPGTASALAPAAGSAPAPGSAAAEHNAGDSGSRAPSAADSARRQQKSCVVYDGQTPPVGGTPHDGSTPPVGSTPHDGTPPRTHGPDRVRALASDAILEPVWQNKIGGLTFRATRADGIRYIKWGPRNAETSFRDEAERLRWAAPYTPVPAVLDEGRDATHEWLVTTAMPGLSAVDPRWLAEPARAVRALGRGLRDLHEALPVAECPFVWDVAGRVDNAAGRGIQVPDHLRSAPPIDRLVVCQGDPCAPNTLIGDDGQWTAHVDLGSLGVADRWADLAVAALSTEWNYGPGWHDTLLDAYGVTPDAARLAFYRALWNAT